MARLTFRLLGALEVMDGDRLVRVGAAKPRALLTILLLNANRVVSTDAIIDQLWSGEPPSSATVTLHGYVSGLRKALGAAGGGELLQRRAPGYVLEIGPGRLDIDEFDRLTALGQVAIADRDWPSASRVLADALALWRGAALADVAEQPWAEARAVQLEEARLVALDGWITAELALGRHAEVVGAIESAVAATPLREQLHSHLMLALYRSGRQADALRAFQALRTILVDELGIEPTPQIVALESAILAQDRSLDWRPEARPAVTMIEALVPTTSGAHARPTTNLRPPLSPLVGRTSEIAEVAELVRHNRLVTVTGPGGAGKTRLAYEASSRLADGFNSGAWMVELAPVTDPDDVADAIGAALQLAEPGLDAVIDFLRNRMILLIIDNCEHLVDRVAAVIGELLSINPLLFVIATSRETLSVPGEHVYSIPPLGEDEAVELFATRARSVAGRLTLDESTTAAVSSICRRLDGMPLAVELAAARCRAFTPQQLASRLDDRFGLLTSGSRSALPRHQTLRNVVEWSYNLLLDDERILFERLSVLTGSYTVEAVEAICADERLLAHTIGDALARLVDKSVVQVRPGTDGDNRYAMLETLVEYARELLSEEDRRLVSGRHADHYAGLVSRGVLSLRGDDQRAWLQQIAREYENVRAALTWSLSSGANERCAAMIGGLGWYWWAVGAVHEGWRWARRAMELAPLDSSRVAAAGTTWAAFLGACCEERDLIGPMIDAGDVLVRDNVDEDPQEMLLCRVLLARAEQLRGDFAKARPWFVEALQIATERNEDPRFLASALFTAGQLGFIEGRGEASFSLLEQGARMVDELGDWASATICHAEIALVAETIEDFDRMRAGLDEARRLAGELGVSSLELAMAARVACAAVLQGNDDEATILLDEVIQWAGDVAHRPALGFAKSGVARLRHRQGRLLEAADAAREALALPTFEKVRVRGVLLEILASAEAATESKAEVDNGLSAI